MASTTRVIATKADADAIKDEWEEFVEDWLPSYLDDENRMPSGGWGDLMDKGEKYLELDLGSSLESPGYKRLLSIAKRVKNEMD